MQEGGSSAPSSQPDTPASGDGGTPFYGRNDLFRVDCLVFGLAVASSIKRPWRSWL